jgi:ferrochelatase
VWTEEGSPLLVYGRAQAAGLAARLRTRLGIDVPVALGMRYGAPAVADALESLRAQGVRRLLILPLYPQYSGSTTGSTFDATAAALSRWRWLPELRMITQYHDHPAYIAALAASVREHWAENGRGEHLLMSFHGLPRRYLTAGDPYHCHCHKTARLLARELGLQAGSWTISFQSRVGREEWLRPYTDETVQALGNKGIRSLDVICPGFSADCLETLEEIAMQNRDFFIEAGGTELNYIPALNARDDHLELLTDLVLTHAQGWPETGAGFSSEHARRDAEAAASRARALGAQR